MRVSDRQISSTEILPDNRPSELRSAEQARARVAPPVADGRRAADSYVRTASASEALRREELAAGPLGAVAKAARLVTKVFGFRLGKFGLTYRTQDVAVDMEAVARDLAERARREARERGRLFGEELDAARVLTLTEQPPEAAEAFTEPEAFDAQAAQPEGVTTAAAPRSAAAQPQSWLLRLAFALYGRNAEPAASGVGGADQPARSRLLAVA